MMVGAITLIVKPIMELPMDVCHRILTLTLTLTLTINVWLSKGLTLTVNLTITIILIEGNLETPMTVGTDP